MDTSLTHLQSFERQEVAEVRGYRDGIEIDKGVVLTETYLKEHWNFFADVLNKLTVYPDVFIDIITPTDSNFKLFFYQRLVLRAVMRYKEIYITACRAFSKSYISILGMILQCIFIPGTRRFIAAPQKKQGASIAKEKILEIYERFPLIRKEVVGGKFSNSPGNFGSDYVVLTFLNGSTFEVKNPTASLSMKIAG